MRQNEPEFFNVYQSKHEIANLVGLTPDDILDELPIEEVSTGNTMLMVPIKNLSAMGRAVGNMNGMTDFFNNKAEELMDSGLELNFDPNIKSGFRIGPKDGSYYISFTDKDFENYFKKYLKEKTRNLVFE